MFNSTSVRPPFFAGWHSGTGQSVGGAWVTVLLGLVAFLVYAVRAWVWRTPSGPNEIPEIGGLHILNASAFFSRRYDFMKSHFERKGNELFRFRILQHEVVCVSGDAGRKVFFGDKDLDLVEGYKILRGGAPDLKDINKGPEKQDDTSAFNKTLLLLFQKDRLTDVLPTLFADINKTMMSWGVEGRVNPFNEIYNLVFQMTVRMASCRELAEDQAAVARLAELYWDLERNTTPAAVLLPWIPTPSRRAKEAATMGLFMTLSQYVAIRRNAAVPAQDAVDLLIAEGKDDVAVVQFILSVIFSGVINTGINASWNFLYLDAHPEWKQKVISEINALVSKYSGVDEGNGNASTPLHQRLSTIPITAWEEEMPSLDLVIRETLRLTLSLTPLRRNIVRDLAMGDKIVRKGAFLVHSLRDVHLNADIYSDPWKFDPDRYREGREEDKKGTFSYLGWGAGRHICTGMKIAKLEIKMITALFLSGYEYQLVDGSGKYPAQFPLPDRNDMQAWPLGEPCYLAFKRVSE